MMKDLAEGIEKYISGINNEIKNVFYAKALSCLAREKIKIENFIYNATTDIEKEAYTLFLSEIDSLIAKYWNYQYNLLKGKRCYDVVDALGAIMILDIKQAKNVLYHASIYSNNSRQISFQTLLDDLMLVHNKMLVIPRLTQKSNDGTFEISCIDKDVIEIDLRDTHFIGHDFIPAYTLKHGTITNYYEIGKRLLRFLRFFDCSISKNDLVILYITLTQIAKEQTTPLEIDMTRDKINNIFLSNPDLNRKFCVLIDLSRKHIASMIDLRNSLAEYFMSGTKISSSTMRDYLSDDLHIKRNADKFMDEVKFICKL